MGQGEVGILDDYRFDGGRSGTAGGSSDVDDPGGREMRGIR